MYLIFIQFILIYHPVKFKTAFKDKSHFKGLAEIKKTVELRGEL